MPCSVDFNLLDFYKEFDNIILTQIKSEQKITSNHLIFKNNSYLCPQIRFAMKSTKNDKIKEINITPSHGRSRGKTTAQYVQHLCYLPFGESFVDQRVTNYEGSRYTFSGKERDSETGYSYFGARYYSSDYSIWLSVDPLSDNTPFASPYAYCINNPIILHDPNGEDWYEVENTDTKQKEIKWTDHKSQAAMDEKKVKGTYLGEAVAVFEGSRDEKLGKGDNLFGEGAVLAKATVYGTGGADDIKEYDAFTMSSDFSKYGAIADGQYTVNYKDPGKTGALKSNWALNNGGAVDCLDGKNPNPNGYSATQKNGIYIHRSNNNGWAGGTVSTGCLLIVPSTYDSKGNSTNNGWNQFNNQLKGVKSFPLILRR